jgi:hypothetical protein
MRYYLQFFAFASLAVGQTTPSITAITNAALPGMDVHAPVRLQPRSMASIFGSNLSTATASTTPPWATALGGVELHLVPLYVGCGTSTPPATCDILATLIFVSPTQINFLVPDVLPSAYGQQQLVLDAVILENGQRFDSGVLLYLSPVGDFAVFGVGYDCDFSLSLTQPHSCGYSQTPGPNTVPIGAVTDVSGNLVTSENPIHQSQVIVLWSTGLGSMSINQSTGLLQQDNPNAVTFGIAQSNTAGGYNIFTFNWRTQIPLWAGESPQYVGLDQINVAFPTCNGTVATTEERYIATLTFIAQNFNTGYPGNNSTTLYMPFLISPGEPTCQFGATTTTTVVSTANPYDGTQTLVFTASVSPSAATGTITLLDGKNVLLIGNLLSGGSASLPATPTGSGNHSIKAVYSGNSTFAGSTGTITESVTKPTLTPTTTAVTSSVNPSLAGQQMTFTATVSPCCLPTGSVSFSFGNLLLCAGSIIQGKSLCQTYGIQAGEPLPALSAGSYSVTATYNGDTNYASSSAIVNQVIQPNQGTLSITAWTYRGGTGATEAALGEQVSFSASVGPSAGLIPTGTITFFDGPTSFGTVSATSGEAGPTTFSLALGTHSITASYSGDLNFSSATSNKLTITIWTASSFTSTPNPSTAGQAVSFTLCGIPSNVTNGYVMFIVDGSPGDVRIASPCTSDGIKSLVSGTHLVKVGLVDIPDRSVPTVSFRFSITQVVN